MVIGLLIIERKRNPWATFALWIPTISMMISASRPLGRWFSAAEEGFLDPLVLALLILVSVIILIRRQINWAWILQDNRYLFLLIVYAAVSILWSDIPFVSIKRWIRLMGGVFLALVVVSEPKPLKALESIFRRGAYVLVPFSLVLVKYFPEFGRDYGMWSGLRMWTGVTLQKNSLGILCVLSGMFLIWGILQEWKMRTLFRNLIQNIADMVVLGIALVLLFGAGESYSATSIGILIIGIAIILVLRNKKAFAKFVTRYLKSFLIFLLFMFLLLHEIILSPITSVLGRDETFTGRIEIWELLIDFASRNPIFGVGYGGFYAPGNWDLEHFFTTEFILANAHSGYLAVYVELGIVGLIFLGIFILSYCGKVRREMDYSLEWGIIGLCLLPMSLLYNYTEVGFVQSGNYLWSAMVFVMIVFSTSSASFHLAFKKWQKMKINHGMEIEQKMKKI